MYKLVKYSLICGFCFIMAGCTTSDDPRDGGFVSGVYNSVLTDGYARREAREQATLDNETAKQSSLTARAHALQQQRKELSEQLTVLQSQAGSLNRQLQELRKQVATSRDEQQRQRVEAAMLALEKVNASLTGTDWQAQPVDEAKRRLKELKTQMRDITKVAEAGS